MIYCVRSLFTFIHLIVLSVSTGKNYISARQIQTAYLAQHNAASFAEPAPNLAECCQPADKKHAMCRWDVALEIEAAEQHCSSQEEQTDGGGCGHRQAQELLWNGAEELQLPGDGVDAPATSSKTQHKERRNHNELNSGWGRYNG